MPTFRITDPNSGRILQVTGDTPPTQEELTQLFAQFQVETVPEIDPIFSALASKQGPIDAALISAGRGLTNIARGLGLADPAGEAERLGFEALEEQRPISTTVGEIAGEAAPFLLPGGAIGKLATIPGRVAASGLLGATEGGIIARGRGSIASIRLQISSSCNQKHFHIVSSTLCFLSYCHCTGDHCSHH